MATTTFLVSHAIKVTPADTERVQDILNKSFAAFENRIASIIAVTTLSHGTHIVRDVHVNEARELFGPTGWKGTGGSMPSEFYGTPNSSYGMGSLNLNTDTIDFNNGIARPELIMSGGGKKSLPLSAQNILNIMKIYKVKCSPPASAAIVALVSEYFEALAAALAAKTKAALTSKRLSTVLFTKKFAMFN